MKIITHDMVQNLNLSEEDCYKWAVDVLSTKERDILPPKISMKPSEGVFFNVLPCILPDYGLAGLKMVNRHPDKQPSLDSKILLYNLNGEALALIDGNFITAMRTGAVAAHSISLLAKPDFSVLGMMGLGNTARAAFKILMYLYPDRSFTVKLVKYKNQHREFADVFKDKTNVRFVFVDSAEEAAEGSDVIIEAVTYLKGNVCPDSCFKPGCLVVPIHTMGFQNCDLFFDKVYGDDYGHISSFKYFDKFKWFAEVSQVVTGAKPGRQSNDERIIVYNVGIALHDVYFAGKIYSMCNNALTVDMQSPTEKIWIK